MANLWCLLLLAAPALARDITDEEYARFPRLYHLDDYSACLSQTDGLYCLGSFHIAPLKQPHPLYNMLKEYSSDRHHFNRTQLHRGYCVSSRCPSISERNASLRFERCASHWARRLALRTTLSQLSYCRTHAQEYAQAHSPAPMDLAQKVFLYVVGGIIVLNVLGTVYDVATGDHAKKNPLISSWSVRSNWRRLTASYEDGDPRLAALTPVQGVRVLLMMLIMATHSGCIHDMLYLYNPRWIEQISRHPVLMIFLNGTSVVQIFVLLSNFLLGYNLLLYTKSNVISFRLLPYITLKRIARISPVYLLVTGYAATWWARSSSGPLWAPTVGAESDVCRRKFWSHVFYVHNLLDPEDICLVQTWFLAVDMQLLAPAALLALRLARRRHARAALARLVLLSCVLNGVLAYAFEWKSIMYFAYPSALKTMYSGIPSFPWLYQAPWGSLPACLMGLLLAFLHFELQEAGVKVSSYKVSRLAPRCIRVGSAADSVVDPRGQLLAAVRGGVVHGRVRRAGAAGAQSAGGRDTARHGQWPGGLAAAADGVARLAGDGPHVAVGADAALDPQPQPRRQQAAAYHYFAVQCGGGLDGHELRLVPAGRAAHAAAGDAAHQARRGAPAQGHQAGVAAASRTASN